MFSIEQVVTKEKAKSVNAVVLAFIGDAVYSLFVREKLAENTDFKTGELNRLSSAEVCAEAQARKAERLLPVLTDEETEIFKRGRNAKKPSRAKHASVADYNASTGFEAVLGYLYITGERERLDYILNY